MTGENEPGRKRGGQPGNRNALRHGYYSRVFTREENADLRSAADVSGLDEEIALVRHVIKKAAASPDDRHMLIMIRAANVLNRLVRTRKATRTAGKRPLNAFAMPSLESGLPSFRRSWTILKNEADLP